MPTLYDAPTIPKLTGAAVAADDLIQIYDTSSRQPKTITVAELITALDALDGGVLADS
jgi:hypothetical protein